MSPKQKVWQVRGETPSPRDGASSAPQAAESPTADEKAKDRVSALIGTAAGMSTPISSSTPPAEMKNRDVTASSDRRGVAGLLARRRPQTSLEPESPTARSSDGESLAGSPTKSRDFFLASGDDKDGTSLPLVSPTGPAKPESGDGGTSAMQSSSKTSAASCSSTKENMKKASTPVHAEDMTDGRSDLSDLSEDDEEEKKKRRSRRRSGGSKGGEEGDDFDEEDEEERSDDDDDDGIEWQEYLLSPLSVRFSQEIIHPFFYRRGPIQDVIPKITARTARPEDDEGEGYRLIPPFPPIRILRRGPQLYSLDNRRLYALQKAAMNKWPQLCKTRVLVADRLPRKKLKNQYRKFKTTSEGREIRVTSKYKLFENWRWFTNAANREAENVSGKAQMIFFVFQTLPFLFFLGHWAKLWTIPWRAPLFFALFLAFGLDSLRCKIGFFEQRISELHTAAVAEGEARSFPCSCDRRNDGRPGEETCSAQLLCGLSACALALVAPYIALLQGRHRSSALSCWTGFACVLTVRFIGMLWRQGPPESQLSDPVLEGYADPRIDSS